jgi:hypothetical protein
MSYQAVNRIANELESLGYVAKSHAANSTVKRDLLLTERGLALITDLVSSIRIVESEIRQVIGEDDFNTLCEICERLFRKTGRPGDFLKEVGELRIDDKPDKTAHQRRIDLGIAELLLFVAAKFDDSKHRRSHHLRLSRLVSGKKSQLVSWSESGRRMTGDTIVDVELVAQEIRRRYGAARLNALLNLVETLASELD